MVRKRKPVLIIDNGADSSDAIELLRKNDVEFVEYDIRKFAESCCGDLPTTVAPSVFAPEGVFKGLNGVREYVTLSKEPNAFQNTSESAYW
jgi:hypothetical protein